MKFKVPTFHTSGPNAEVDDEILNKMDNKKLFEASMKSLSGWVFFWFLLSSVIYLSLLFIGTGGNLLEISGYTNLIVGSLLVYTNSIGGSSFITGGGLVSHKIIMKDYIDSRVRVFTKWVGPSIGVLLGIFLVIISSFTN